jgi:mono/diheme cytochrome c family protein
MRGKLPFGPGRPAEDPAASAPTGGGIMAEGLRRVMPLVAGLAVILMASPSGSQGNIDAGKTPAQIFSDTCSACHRRPQELKSSSASFLRRHYMTGTAEASAMATYLAAVGNDPRADQRKDRAKAQQERLKAQQDKDKAKAQAQATPAKGRRPTAAETAQAAEVKPEEPSQQAEAPVIPALEPFEE